MKTLTAEPVASTETPPAPQAAGDYAFVTVPARVAVYDDLRSAPRIISVDPAPTAAFIESLTTTVYEQSKALGGSVPYTVIREVSENFIHAAFKEVVVSVLDQGDTIRFADQGPGIEQKEKAQLPGFSSAVEPMKAYIRGVGSGLPIVKEYLGASHGQLTIEDNLRAGAVVTISLRAPEPPARQARTILGPIAEERVAHDQAQVQMAIAPLSPRERLFLKLLLAEGVLGVTDISTMTDTAGSSTHSTLKRLEESGLVEHVAKKRRLTPLGRQCAQALD